MTCRPPRAWVGRQGYQASRSPSLSEWAFNVFAVTGVAFYPFGEFLEIYNNADSTVYLDGMTVAEGFAIYLQTTNTTCDGDAAFNNDPSGVWARFMARFPGTGHDHPLLPRHVAVIATDAINHGTIVSGGLDLSQADFEFAGTADVDNPAVPNMIDIGPSSHSDGHGIYFPLNAAVAVLALPVDVATLARRTHVGTTDYVRIPKDKVLDVLWIESAYHDPAFIECPRLVNSAFDRAASAARGADDAVEWAFSLSRSGLSGAGSVTLQHTRSGFADFVRTSRTPGSVQP